MHGASFIVEDVEVAVHRLPPAIRQVSHLNLQVESVFLQLAFGNSNACCEHVAWVEETESEFHQTKLLPANDQLRDLVCIDNVPIRLFNVGAVSERSASRWAT